MPSGTTVKVMDPLIPLALKLATATCPAHTHTHTHTHMFTNKVLMEKVRHKSILNNYNNNNNNNNNNCIVVSNRLTALRIQTLVTPEEDFGKKSKHWVSINMAIHKQRRQL